MTDSAKRSGLFLTPLLFAHKAIEKLDQRLGNAWLQSGNYRLWDMAAGTGHLELPLPEETQQFCYLSTLEYSDVDVLKQTFPLATVFPYNYLEDAPAPPRHRREMGCKLPPALQKDLANPALKWVVLVNPPYATAQEAGLKGRNKAGVAQTRIRKQMHAENLGEVSRELYVQFLYRIMHEFKHRETVLGLFAPLKYLVSANYQKFRDDIFQAGFHSGFLFSSENFGGTSRTRHFPISFILWNLHPKKNVAEQEIRLDVLDQSAQKIGEKVVKPRDRSVFLSRWIKRPRGTKIFPPFGSALTIKSENIDTRNRIADGFLASLMCPGNELQNQQQTAFLSGPQASAGALSVTPDNFEQSVVVFAARRIPQDSWMTHVDQLLRPCRTLSPQFIANCALWSLFDSKNQTVSLRNVRYQGRDYQITNHFFPFPIADLHHWVISDPAIQSSLAQASNSFVADWIARQTLSAESRDLLMLAKEVYRHFFSHLHLLRIAEFGIEMYDAGWFQIRNALNDAKSGGDLLDELKRRHDALQTRILPLLYDYGIVSL